MSGSGTLIGYRLEVRYALIGPALQAIPYNRDLVIDGVWRTVPVGELIDEVGRTGFKNQMWDTPNLRVTGTGLMDYRCAQMVRLHFLQQLGYHHVETRLVKVKLTYSYALEDVAATDAIADDHYAPDDAFKPIEETTE